MAKNLKEEPFGRLWRADPFKMLYILPSDPPSHALSWETVDFTSPDEIVVSAVGLHSKQRAVLLKLALDAAKRTTVQIYTGIPTSNSEAPCGCAEYDVCWYHRYGEPDVAECYCSCVYNTRCEYHKGE
jgi:hypothetical protein